MGTVAEPTHPPSNDRTLNTSKLLCSSRLKHEALSLTSSMKAQLTHPPCS